MSKPTHIVPENERTYLFKPGHRARAHPLSDAFPLYEHEIKVLADDIKKNGQQVSVVLQKAPSGEPRVLDGRSRLLACEQASIKPLATFVSPKADALRVILSTNARRRHQDRSQRAMSAARLANITRGRPTGIASIEAISQEQAAELLGTSRTGVQRAAAILDDAILVPAVDAGDVAVSDAYAIRDAPDDDKRRAVAAVAADKARTLRAALQPEAPANVQEEPASEAGGDRSAAGPPAGAGADPMEARDAPARSDSGAEPDAGDAAATDSDSQSDESVGSSIVTVEPTSGQGPAETAAASGGADTSPGSPLASPAPAEVPAEGASAAKAAAVTESGPDSHSDDSAGSSIAAAEPLSEPTSGQGPAETAAASGGADTSPGSPSASPAAAAVPAEGASTAEPAEVRDAANARSDVPSHVHELKDASERLDSMIAQGDQGDIQHLRSPVRFRAASLLVRKLTTMMAQWLEERTDDDAAVDRTEDLPSTVDSLLKQLAREHFRDAQG